MSYSFKALDIFVALAITGILARLLQRRHAQLPPGPRGIPWFGNIFQWPGKKEWVTFNRWARRYGMSPVFI